MIKNEKILKLLITKFVFFIFFVIVCSSLFEAKGIAADVVKLQLAWKHQFQFAGYYAALYKKFYQEAGLDVKIIEGGNGKFAREEINNGNAEYGIAGSELILNKADGDKIVVLAAFFQHSPSILLTKKNNNINNLHDLIGKKVMLLPGNKDADILAAFFNEGISLDKINRIDQSYNLNDLIDGDVDAVSAYLTNEPWIMKQKGVEPKIIKPQTYGVDFYSDCLFTNTLELEKHPARVRKFLLASKKGWNYAMSHTEEIIELIISKYGVKKERAHLNYEAIMLKKIMLPDLVDIGHMNPGRWQHIVNTYAKLHMINADFPINGFLYNPYREYDYTFLKWAAGIAGVFCVFVLSIAGILFIYNKKLSLEIIERKAVAGELEKSDLKHKAMIENITDVIAIIDSEGIIRYKSPNIEKLFGWPPEELIGKHAWTTAHPDDKNRVKKNFSELIAGYADSHSLEYLYKCKNGDYKLIRIFAKNLIHDENINGVLVSYHDITKRRQAEDALRTSENKYRTTLNSLPLGVVVHGHDTSVQLSNPEAEKLLGQTKDRMSGKDAFDDDWNFIKEDTSIMEPSEYPVNIVRESGKELKDYILGIKKKDCDSPVWVNVNAVPVYDGFGSLEKIIVNFIDITARKHIEAAKENLEAQLRQAAKIEAIGTLAGGVAHDFNNILGIIIGNVELAIEDIPEWSPARENLDEVKIAGIRARNVVRQLLSFTRNIKTEKKIVNLFQIVEETLQLLRASIPSYIDVKLINENDTGNILADATQIHQILINLCTNASHSMEDNGGKLEIIISEVNLPDDESLTKISVLPGRYVKLSIIDNGTGIDPEIKDRIFDPYFTTKDIGKGSGIGLSVVYGIIKNYNGAIHVESELGKGTNVSVYFPVVSGKIETDKKYDHEDSVTGNENLLLVDDEPALGKMAQRILEKLGYNVEVCTSPVEALQKFSLSPEFYDLIISDLTMPHMTGDKLIKEILKIKPNIPSVLCTGFSDKFDMEQLEDTGIHLFIEKPVNWKKLAGSIRKIFNQN